MMNILTVEQIIDIYGFNKKYTYKLLKTRGCPVLPREKNDKYRVIQEEFDQWLKTRFVA